MADPVERTQFGGLSTDPIPTAENLGIQCMRCENVLPVSATTIRPREGVTEIAQYRPGILGRVLIVDAAHSDLTNAVLVVAMNNQLTNSSIMVHEVEGIGRFRPSRVASLYASVLGTNLGTKIYGVYNGVPRAFDFILGTYQDFTPASYAGETFQGAVYTAQITYNEAGWSAGTFTYNSGLVFFQTFNAVVAMRNRAYDPATLAYTLDDPYLSPYGHNVNSTYAFRFGTSPLSSAKGGYASWSPDTGNNPQVVIVRNTTWDGDGVSQPNGVGSSAYFITNSDLIGAGQPLICDISPGSKAFLPVLIAGRFSTSAGNEQIVVVKEPPNFPVAGITTLTYDTVVQKDFVQADWTGWTDRPNTALDVQQIPQNAPLNPGNIVALFGNWSAPTLHRAVTNPRLALLNGGAQTGTGRATTVITNASLTILNSHANGTTYAAHGMVVNQFGEVYACGTGDFVAGAANYLIVKYNPSNFTTPMARVAHTSNGLGDGYANPLDTHICNPMWDGTYFMVLDHDTTKTRLFVYDRNLTFISKTTLVTSADGAPRVYANKYSTKFFGLAY